MKPFLAAVCLLSVGLVHVDTSSMKLNYNSVYPNAKSAKRITAYPQVEDCRKTPLHDFELSNCFSYVYKTVCVNIV